jgi:hypothetical protein
VRSSARVLPEALPELREIPLTDVPLLFHGRAPDAPSGTPKLDDREFDVFVSHASEDKDEIVRPLVHALRDTGLTVWFDELELKIGNSLRRKIDHGLARSRFGIVVLSSWHCRTLKSSDRDRASFLQARERP